MVSDVFPLERVCSASAGEVGAVVEVHMAAFPDFFMTELGPMFLRRYYRIILRYDGRIFLVAESDDCRVQGFAAGFTNPRRFYEILLGQRLQLAIACMPALAVRPWLAPRLLATRRRVQDLSVDGELGHDEALVELVSIAVAPGASGRGVGKALVTRFCQQAKSLGAREVYLTTEAESNDSVNAFYRSLGFEAARTLTRFAGRRMTEYRRSVV